MRGKGEGPSGAGRPATPQGPLHRNLFEGQEIRKDPAKLGLTVMGGWSPMDNYTDGEKLRKMSLLILENRQPSESRPADKFTAGRGMLKREYHEFPFGFKPPSYLKEVRTLINIGTHTKTTIV